jgi:Tfp pilus assembly protein PilX
MSALQDYRPHQRQKGVVLFIALIALVALSLAAVALVRSVDSGNVISGNLAFRQATLQASDHGVEAAFIALGGITNQTNTFVANQYRPTRLDVATNGSTRDVNWVNDIVWANIPCRDNSNAAVNCANQEYKVKYFIDRLCGCPGTLSAINSGGSCSTTVTDKQLWCVVDLGSGKTGSKGAYSTSFTSVSSIYYRVTVQVTGPRNTTTYVQTIFSIG